MWDQIKRRDEELEYKKHKCKNAMFSLAKREFLSKRVALHSLGLHQLVTQKSQVLFILV